MSVQQSTECDGNVTDFLTLLSMIADLICKRFNPFPDEQLNLAGHRAKTSLPFLFTFDILFRMQNDQPASSSPTDRLTS